MMIASVATMQADTDKADVLLMFVIAIFFYVVMPFVAYGIARLLLVKKEESQFVYVHDHLVECRFYGFSGDCIDFW